MDSSFVKLESRFGAYAPSISIYFTQKSLRIFMDCRAAQVRLAMTISRSLSVFIDCFATLAKR
ncbi:hypothetical protein BKN38_01015 [Helicobacter sp. CLO-3]|nr:hypothetical protein BA723_05355 [Helicobacter sp. CLO-3]OHU85629.1 hypothetical protein BKN38_01015 [Helicobacter sp. CLO-3]